MELIKRTGSKLCKGGRSYAYYGLFKCPYCKKEVERQFWKGNHSESCGCVHQELIDRKRIKHGQASAKKGITRLYKVWSGMKTRCNCSKRRDYKWYGGKGIEVCDEWQIFDNFRIWAESNGYSDNLTIDRIDSDKGYCPENCRWIPFVENIRNKKEIKLTMEKANEIRRKYKTGRYTLNELGKEYKISSSVVSGIINNKIWRIYS